MRVKFHSLIVVVAMLAPNAGLAADKQADPAPTKPCTAAMDGPDYVPGVDARGEPVPRADIGAEHTAIPDQVFVPLPDSGRGQRLGRAGRGAPGPYAAIDGRRLDPLLNPPACPVPGRN